MDETTMTSSPQQAEKKKTTFSTSIKLPWKQVIGDGLGQFGFSFPDYIIVGFLTIFFTDAVGVEMAAVSLLVLIVRLFDAINDPFIGGLADRTRSKHGRYRPWVLWGGIAAALLTVLLFSARPEWNYNVKVVFMYVVYILTSVASTCFNMAFLAMNSVQTSDRGERMKLASVRMLFFSLAMTLTGTIVTGFQGVFVDDPAMAYQMTAVLVAVISIPCLIICFRSQKEIILPTQESRKQKMPFSEMAKAVLGNGQLLIVVISIFVYGIAVYSRLGVMTYYFTYNWGAPAMIGVYTAVSGAASFVGAVLSPAFMRLFKTKRNSIIVSAVISGVLFIASYFVADATLFWVFTFIIHAITSVFMTTNKAMIPDVADYTEYKTGKRMDGLFGAMDSLMRKAGQAVGPALAGFLMAAAGYIANQAQTQEVLDVINVCANIIPGVMLFVSAALTIFYKLDRKKYVDILAHIAENREKTE